ncbi:MAG: 30S ribosomal protein S6 [Bacteroidetes bacterium]|nr:30S ribosomal protein S6 [Bacteroidota bacterium]
MTKKMYESAVLINAALEEDQIQSIISRIKELISSNDGEITDVEDWGRKRLAYMIKRSKIGYYIIFQFNAYPQIISPLEKFYKLDENILRYLNIKLTKNALEQIEKNKEQLLAEAENVIVENEVIAKAENNIIDSIKTEKNS